jgi:hypothetical protein
MPLFFPCQIPLMPPELQMGGERLRVFLQALGLEFLSSHPQ